MYATLYTLQENNVATVLEIHRLLSNTIWMFYLALGLWGLYRAIRREPVDGSYVGAIAIIQLVVLLQGVLGFVLHFDGARPERANIHILYGIFSLIFLPGMFAYLRGDDSNRAQWVYALSTLFMFGVALRTISTGV